MSRSWWRISTTASRRRACLLFKVLCFAVAFAFCRDPPHALALPRQVLGATDLVLLGIGGAPQDAAAFSTSQRGCRSAFSSNRQ